MNPLSPDANAQPLNGQLKYPPEAVGRVHRDSIPARLDRTDSIGLASLQSLPLPIAT